MQTYSGEQIWPLDPRADEVHLDDICVGLARECRYGNHCRDFYSVAEHSVIVSLNVERIALNSWWSPAKARLAARQALLHDASEAYIGDIPSPLKSQRAMRGYRRVESRWEDAVNQRFGVRPTRQTTELVHEVDRRVVLDEVEALMLDPHMWVTTRRRQHVEPLGAEIAAMPWQHAAVVFSQRFAELFPEFTP
ncbi:MAG: YfbR-like 5'-deoxynucleotidase [Kofleriaceae bacterium]